MSEQKGGGGWHRGREMSMCMYFYYMFVREY